MRSAPSVVYPVGRCAFFGRLVLLLWTAALAALVGWVWHGAGRHFEEALWLGSGGWVLWSAWAFKAWWHTPVGAIQWDSLDLPADDHVRAGAWRWLAEDGSEGVLLHSIECALDCQNWVLLRLKMSSSRAMWVWAERDRAPSLWGDLRRALTAASQR